ncbi:MAG: hypothetical protein ACWA5U_10540 [bacterium]
MSCSTSSVLLWLLLLLGTLLAVVFPELANAHIKWFVEFDVSDPPQPLLQIHEKIYYRTLLVLSAWGILFALLLDSLLFKRLKNFSLADKFFPDYEDVALNIARIGTGVFFIVLWLVGGIILTPELLTEKWYISYVQLLIAFAVLFKRGLVIAGIGIIFLYGYAMTEYGVFHLLDYVLLLGLAIYLILSGLANQAVEKWRLPVLYYGLIFSFLWSAVEKIAYPHWFYPFLEKHSFIMMGLDMDFFIACAAFAEFVLFFLLLISNNGKILLAFAINLLITAGNIYFGKVDAIGHFPTNFILLIILFKGALPASPLTRWMTYPPANSSYLVAIKGTFLYILAIPLFVTFYYSLHWVLYAASL